MKVCSHISCSNKVFSKGLCRTHWLQKYGKPLKKTSIKKVIANNSNTPKKARKPIKKISDKRAKELAIYSNIRRERFEEALQKAKLIGLDYVPCEMNLDVCTKEATDWHHPSGRTNGKLLNKDGILCCRACHTYVTEHSKEAIEMGLSYRRNTPFVRITSGKSDFPSG